MYTPKNPNGGGISRRLDGEDRINAKKLLNSLTIPDNMSVILRTSGINNTKEVIEWDMNYLIEIYENIIDKSVLKDAGPDGGRELKKDKSPKTEDSGRPINPRLPNFGDVLNLKSEVSVHKSANANRTSPGDAKLDQFFDY